MSGEFFYNFSVFGEIEKSLNGQNCFEYIEPLGHLVFATTFLIVCEQALQACLSRESRSRK